MAVRTQRFEIVHFVRSALPTGAAMMNVQVAWASAVCTLIVVAGQHRKPQFCPVCLCESGLPLPELRKGQVRKGLWDRRFSQIRVGVSVGIVDAAMKVGELIQKLQVSRFILDAQIPAVIPSALFSMAIGANYPTCAALVAFLQPQEEAAISPEGQFAGGGRSIDVFVILIPSAHNPIEALDLFQWGLVEGAALRECFERVLDPLDTFLTRGDA